MSVTARTLSAAACILAGAGLFSLPAHAADWKSGVPRTAYVNLFEWNWDSVARECVTFLGPKGYSAVQVSPPQEHATGSEWWRRYQPVSYQLKSRSGNRAQFNAMVKICKLAGVDVYVDTVINHMAAYEGGVGSGGSQWGARNFPAVPYSPEHFHTPKCDIASADYNNNRSNVTQCDLPGMPDLDTSNPYVQGKIASYMKDLLSLGVAGFRIDAAKHIKPEELAAIKAQVPGDYFLTQEVIKDGALYNSGDVNRYPEIGTVNEFNNVYAMKNSFMNLYGFNISRLPEEFATWGFYPSDKATVFVNNHDTERKLCDKIGDGNNCDSLNVYNREKLFLANIFMLAWPYGYPQVMSGYNFNSHDMGPIGQPYKHFELIPSNCSSDPTAIGKWDCTHRDNRVANMVGFRNYTAGTNVVGWLADGNDRIAFSRGNKGFVAINNTANYWQKTFATNLPDGQYCNVVQASAPETGLCPEAAKVNVVNGQTTLSVAPNSAVALHFGATVAPSLLYRFKDTLNVTRASEQTSSSIQYLSLKAADVTVSNGEYSINGGAFTSAPGKISFGQKLKLKTTAPLTDNTAKLVQLKLGNTGAVWRLSTGGAPCTETFCPSKTPLDYSPSTIKGGEPVTLYYMGTLANSNQVSLHWGHDSWQEVQDAVMTRRGDGFWSVTITPPKKTAALNFVFTDGTNWDSNNGANWNLPVTPAVDLSVTVSFKVTAETRYGESVYITGNQAELGYWSASADPARQCTATNYPEWTCVIKFSEGGKALEYKYQKLGIETVWENGGNRTYTVPAADAVVQEATAFRN